MKLPESNKIYLAATITVLAILVFPFSPALAEEPALDDSIYMYNALENKNPVTLLLYSEPVKITNDGVDDTTVARAAEEDDEGEEEIVQKVGEILEKQNNSLKQAESIIGNIEQDSGIEKFLLGTNLGRLRFQIVQIKDQIYRLKLLGEVTTDPENKNKIEEQIKLASEEQSKIENFITEQEKKFSLLGWFTRVL